jgi:Helix-turn-helix domain
MKPTVLSSDWLTTPEASEELGKSVRTLQKYAKAGAIHWKMGSREGRKPERLYSLADVEKARDNPPSNVEPPRAVPEKPRLLPSAKPEPPVLQKAHHRQEERALDTVSIVGQIMAAHKGELERVMAVMVEMQRAAIEADHQRRKDEREDRRERLEARLRDRAAERKIRLRELRLIESARPLTTPKRRPRSR